MASRAEQLFDEIMANKTTFEKWLNDKKTEGWQEDEFVDFKSSDTYERQNQGKKKYEEFRDSLCEAISAFGNTEGGVVIYGIVCKELKGTRDVIQALQPLNNCTEVYDHFRKIKLNLSIPALNGIRCEAIKNGDGEKGYLIVFIPKGEHLPYRAEHIGAYYQRNIDSNFVMNHEVLRTMFYPKYAPNFQFTIDIDYVADHHLTLDLSLLNTGSATAESLLVETRCLPACQVSSGYGAVLSQSNNQRLDNLIELNESTLSVLPGIELHPGYELKKLLSYQFNNQLLIAHIRGLTKLSLTNGLHISLRVFARNSPAYSFILHLKWDELINHKWKTYDMIQGIRDPDENPI